MQLIISEECEVVPSSKSDNREPKTWDLSDLLVVFFPSTVPTFRLK
jgi:hypothetical protein